MEKGFEKKMIRRVKHCRGESECGGECCAELDAEEFCNLLRSILCNVEGKGILKEKEDGEEAEEGILKERETAAETESSSKQIYGMLPCLAARMALLSSSSECSSLAAEIKREVIQSEASFRFYSALFSLKDAASSLLGDMIARQVLQSEESGIAGLRILHVLVDAGLKVGWTASAGSTVTNGAEILVLCARSIAVESAGAKAEAEAEIAAEAGKVSHQILAGLVKTRKKASHVALIRSEATLWSAHVRGLMKHDPDAFTQPWKHIPNLGHAAAWLICELCEAGSLPGRLLGQVIPISLTLIDDLEDAFTLLGCSTLLKLSSTCTQTELRWHTVPIFDCLERALRKDSKEIVAKVMSTQIQICPLLETRGHRPRFDSTVDLIVSLSIRTVDANKGAFVCGIRDFIRASGLSIVRHLRTLVPFLLDIVSKGAIDGSGEYALNPKERDDALETLSVLLCVAWPRRATFVDAITCALLRALLL